MEKGKLQKEGLPNWNTKNYGEVTEREALERNCKTAYNCNFFLVSPAFTESHQMNLNLPMWVKFPSLRQNMINTTEIMRYFSDFFFYLHAFIF